MIKRATVACVIIALAGANAALAQDIKSTLLQKAEFPEGYETVSTLIEIPAGRSSGRHSSPGIEIVYVIEGELDLVTDGKPPNKLKGGDSVLIPAGAIHDAKASGDKPLKVLGTFIVAKGKPLAEVAR